MADFSRNGTSTSALQPSRLQRRRPSSLQISPPSSSRWNAAIPLLSPLVTSPVAIEQMAEINQQQPSQHRNQVAEPEKAAVFKKWQHPAAPLCCEPSSFVPKFFVPV